MGIGPHSSCFFGYVRQVKLTIRQPLGARECNASYRRAYVQCGGRSEYFASFATEAIPAAPSSEWNEACKLMLQRSVMQLAESLIRPHRSTAAYCYRPSSMVCRSVTVVSPAKTAQSIEIPFGLRTQVGPVDRC